MDAPKNCPDEKRPPEGKVTPIAQDRVDRVAKTVTLCSAMQFTGDNGLLIQSFIGRNLYANLECKDSDRPVLNDGATVEVGDWVIHDLERNMFIVVRRVLKC